MTPCSACARHVKHDETACPFCGTPFAAPAPRARRVVGRVTRAAIFSAALVACGKHDEPVPAPKAGSAEHLDQDFNQLLGSAQTPAASPADAAVALAPDAAVDAGKSDEERTRELQEAQQKKEKDQQQHADAERRRRELEQERLREQQEIRQHYNAKPYGAPPARRRVV
jgi:predicted amidophosphoribosyltransferase